MQSVSIIKRQYNMERKLRSEENALQIKWNKKDYYFDFIPSEHFDEPCNDKIISHSMYWSADDIEEEEVEAKLTVYENIVVLDYIDVNSSELSLDEGKLIIRFSNEYRREVVQMDWEDPDGTVTENAAESNWDLLCEVREGEKYLSEAKRISRNAEIVKSRKHKDNYACQACGYKLKIGKTYIIDCHHLESISQSNGHAITSIDDLVSLCPNCHRIAHSSTPPLDVKEIKEMLTSSFSGRQKRRR